MPAIKPADLKIRVDRLNTVFDNPEKCIAGIRDILDHYATKSLRRNRYSTHAISTLTYNAPSQVTHEITRFLIEKGANQPDYLDRLSKILWKDDYIELKSIALDLQTRLLLIEPKKHLPVIHEWLVSTRDGELLSGFTDIGLVLAKAGEYALLDELIYDWLSDKKISTNKIGLQMMARVIENKKYENMPHLFASISSLLKKSSPALDNALAALFTQLLSHNEKETLYYLRTKLAPEGSSHLKRIIRKTMLRVNPDMKQVLKAMLRNTMPPTGSEQT